MKICISGAGIGGPALAYFLLQSDHEITIVEKSKTLRTGGYVIDVWGLGYAILEQMGVIDEVLQKGYKVQELRLVNETGNVVGGFEASVFDRATNGKFTSVARGDLAEIIFDVVKDRIEVIFGDEISSISETDQGVDITLASGATRPFDMVIGADGLHSKVRSLHWGIEQAFERHLGYYVAAFRSQGYLHRDEDAYVNYAEPGRSISRFAMRNNETLVLFIIHESQFLSEEISNEASQRKALHRIFEASRWECKEILEAMDNTTELYFDRVSQMEVPQWYKGRVGLLGDAAACASLLAGEGSGLAMIEAYVLAGELRRANNDVAKALAAYDAMLRKFVLGKQSAARSIASSFAPLTGFGIWIQRMATKLFRFHWIADLFIGSSLRDDFELPDYGYSSCA